MNEVEVVKKLPAHKSPGPDGFTGEFYTTVQKGLPPILLRLFQKFHEEGRFPNSLYKASIILIPKPDNDTRNKDNYRLNITDEHRC